MFKIINQCDIYVGLWCIYMLQGLLYPQGVINQLLQLIILLWAMIAVFKYVFDSRIYIFSPILKATFLLIVMYTIYGGIYIMFRDTIFLGRYVYLQNSLRSLAPIFLFFYFAMNGKLTSDRIRIYFPILIITCILLYYKIEMQVLSQTDLEEITNNMGYKFVPLIPFLFFYSKKPILQYIFMGVILFYVFMGMKRGAILIGVLGIATFLYANLKNSYRRTKFLVAMLTVVIIVGTSMYIDYMMNNSPYFMARVEQTLEGDSSGRDVLYGTLLNTLLIEQSPLIFCFGRGADSTINIAGNYAHQDWLETFCNNGLIGVIILIFFFYSFGRNVLESRRQFSGMMFYSFATLLLIVFSKSLFSMSIQDLNIAESMLIGYFAYWVTQDIDESDKLEVYE